MLFFTKIYYHMANIWDYILAPSKYYSKKYAKQYSKYYVDEIVESYNGIPLSHSDEYSHNDTIL